MSVLFLLDNRKITAMKIFIFLLCMVKLQVASAQKDSLVVNNTDAAISIRNFLVGFWESDSALDRIQFLSIKNELRLHTTGVYQYEFFKTNSYPLEGVSISWPPLSCLVRKLPEDRIEITYINFGDSPVLIKYKKLP